MSKEKKGQIVNDLQEVFAKYSSAILTDFRGLSAAEIADLRRKLRESGTGYRVVKNTLARLAAGKAGKDKLVGSFEGPVAIAFSDNDITEPAKVLADYIQVSKSTLTIKGGFFGDRLFTSNEVMTLATLPSREVLLAKVVGGVQSPIVMLVNCLASPIREVIGVLQARIQQQEGE